MFSSIRFDDDGLHLLDQRLLPHQEVWLSCATLEQGAQAIIDMVVRGAPAIATAAAYSLAVDARSAAQGGRTFTTYVATFADRIKVLEQTRPTAVNLFHVMTRFRSLGKTWQQQPQATIAAFANAVQELAQSVYDEDLNTCLAIGEAGLAIAAANDLQKLRVLTHCNTGALATSGYGTALGVIRSLFKAGRLDHVYVDETRPYLQGSRLTAYELQQESIPHTLITDSMAGMLMQQHKVDWVVVGADRIALNGDTANKIGTYSVAVLANYHDVAFYVAAPLATFDKATPDGAHIEIELRPEKELTNFAGHSIAPPGTRAYNPSFDVTPNNLIAGFITERGLLSAEDIAKHL